MRAKLSILVLFLVLAVVIVFTIHHLPQPVPAPNPSIGMEKAEKTKKEMAGELANMEQKFQKSLKQFVEQQNKSSELGDNTPVRNTTGGPIDPDGSEATAGYFRKAIYTIVGIDFHLAFVDHRTGEEQRQALERRKKLLGYFLKLGEEPSEKTLDFRNSSLSPEELQDILVEYLAALDRKDSYTGSWKVSAEELEMLLELIRKELAEMSRPI